MLKVFKSGPTKYDEQVSIRAFKGSLQTLRTNSGVKVETQNPPRRLFNLLTYLSVLIRALVVSICSHLSVCELAS